MIKLSELPNDTMLYIDTYDCSADPIVMRKEDYLEDTLFLDSEPRLLYVAEPRYATFNMCDYIEMMSEEMYEDWDEDVRDEIEQVINVKEFEDKINSALHKHPTYDSGEQIEIDMFPKRAESEM